MRRQTITLLFDASALVDPLFAEHSRIAVELREFLVHIKPLCIPPSSTKPLIQCGFLMNQEERAVDYPSNLCLQSLEQKLLYFDIDLVLMDVTCTYLSELCTESTGHYDFNLTTDPQLQQLFKKIAATPNTQLEHTIIVTKNASLAQKAKKYGAHSVLFKTYNP